jgi:hypothetical protein
MMAAIAIDELNRTSDTDFGLAYLYFTYKSQSQGVIDLLCAILKQLAMRRMETIELVRNLYDDHSKTNTRPSIDQIFTTLQSACMSYPRVYVIIDALDECGNDQRNQLLCKLFGLQQLENIHLMATSRFIPAIEQHFQSALKLEIRASDEDVRCYVASQMSHLPDCIQNSDGLRAVVLNKISEAVDGMYVLSYSTKIS